MPTFTIHPDAISSKIGLVETGYSWHPMLRWLLVLPQAQKGKSPGLAERYVACWCPCGTVELLRHPYKIDVYVGVKYYLFRELFGNDELPLEPPHPLVLQEYAEKFWDRLGRTLMGRGDGYNTQIAEMHAQARAFVEGIFQTVPADTWRQVRRTLLPDSS